ncbi:DUF6056 family protein [Luteimonas mephitis]|uniref:DUF6056 family protein n=1 Tax=Luteimonas mephitis TaxID=83615 RepID=UPI00047CCC96|nr:DUF6056 family protein [Luteimonas mephitis]
MGRICLLAVVLTIIVLHVVALGHGLVADDAWFARALDHQSLTGFLVSRYVQWSGRIPVEAALVLVINHPWAWRMINAAMLLLFCHSAGRLALASTGKPAAVTTSLAFALLMLVSPHLLYTAAWWMTGSVNYLWTAALGLYGMLAFVEPRDRGPFARFLCLLASGAAMYNEQVAMALLPAAFLLLGALVMQHRWRRWDVAQVAFMAANALVVFTAPGSHRRYLDEQALRFPDFESLGIADKLAMGFGLVSESVTDPQNLLVAALVVMALVLVVRAPVGKVSKSTMLVVLGVLLLGHVAHALGMGEAGSHGLHALQRLDGAAASSARAYALAAWSAFSVACVVMAVVVASWHALREWKAVLATLLLGLASLGAMGFSPTVYASGGRIHFVCQAALLLAALRLVAGLEREFGIQAAKVGIAIMAIAAAYRVLQLLG